MVSKESFFNKKYRLGTANITIRSMTADDVDEVLKLYQSIEITAKNSRQVLSELGPDSFSKKGGMLCVLDREGLLTYLPREKEQMLVAVDDTGFVCGYIWNRTSESDITDRVTFFDDRNAERDTILQAKKDMTLEYGGEIIVSKSCRERNVSLILFYAAMSQLYQLGYRHSIGEVYEITEYLGNGIQHKVSLLNESSYHVLINIGGNHVGVIEENICKKENLVVRYRSHFFYWEIKKSLGYMENLIRLHNIEEASNEE